MAFMQFGSSLDRSSLLKPGQQVPDLHADALDWFEEVKSAKVSCG